MTEKEFRNVPATASPLSIVREFFPKATKDEAGYILWNHTGWPCFWPARFKSPLSAIRWQVRAYKRGLEKLKPGQEMCDFCNRAAASGDSLCRRCRSAFEEVKRG